MSDQLTAAVNEAHRYVAEVTAGEGMCQVCLQDIKDEHPHTDTCLIGGLLARVEAVLLTAQSAPDVEAVLAERIAGLTDKEIMCIVMQARDPVKPDNVIAEVRAALLARLGRKLI